MIKNNNIRSKYIYKSWPKKYPKDYPKYHNQEIENSIVYYLKDKYIKRKKNYFFRAYQLPFPNVTTQRIAAALRRINENNEIIEIFRNTKNKLWKTKFKI